MQQLFTLVLALILPISINAQILKGKVYDATSTIKGITIYNETQNRVTITNNEGIFNIVAKVNDTLLFESIFHHQKIVILKAMHFEDIAIFELKKRINQLDEVNIKAELVQPTFKEETYNQNLQNLIKEDIKRNPHLYQPTNTNYGVDFIYLIGQLAKLFKRKKVKTPNFSPIVYKQLDSVFSKNSLFNDNLLIKDLKIPKDKKYLFFEFCEAKQISSELLKDTHKMQLLENLVLNSQLFLILLEEYGK